MMNDNQCFISGRLGRDPDVKYTQNGKPYCRLSVASSYKVKDQERTDWVSVQVWGPLAESCGSNLQKGKLLTLRPADAYAHGTAQFFGLCEPAPGKSFRRDAWDERKG